MIKIKQVQPRPKKGRLRECEQQFKDVCSFSHQPKAAHKETKTNSLCLVLLLHFDPLLVKKSLSLFFGLVPFKSILYTLKIVHEGQGDRRMPGRMDGWPCHLMATAILVVDLIDGRFLISGARHNVLIIY